MRSNALEERDTVTAPKSYSCPSVARTSREEAGALFLGSQYKAACVPQTQTLSLCLHQVVQAERNCTLCTPTSCSCTLRVFKARERKPGSRLLIQTCRLCCAEGQERHFFLGMATLSVLGRPSPPSTLPHTLPLRPAGATVA